jgi:hypothetical protein
MALNDTTGLHAGPSARLWEIDAARGIAMLAMIFFHVMWDLQFFWVDQHQRVFAAVATFCACHWHDLHVCDGHLPDIGCSKIQNQHWTNPIGATQLKALFV